MSRLVSCTGKRAYTQWAAAEKEAKRVRRQLDEDIHPYRCRNCGLVHLGSGEGVKDKRVAERRFVRYAKPKEPEKA